MHQVTQLHKEYDRLQSKYGDSTLHSIYGAGCIDNPRTMFVFMNPTGRNLSAYSNWNGIRAPWIGTKQVWGMFNSLGIINSEIYSKISNIKPSEWDVNLANDTYSSIESSSVYITNLAKCTQIDARPLSNMIFKEYLNLMYEEIKIVNPKYIITFGNQVSSILLNMNISVSKYINDEKEVLMSKYLVYPTYYPVGQGRRNMPQAIERIRRVTISKSKT